MILKWLRRVFLFAVLCLLFPSMARAGMVYVSRPFSAFGTVELSTGAYTQIGTTSVQLNALSTLSNGTVYGMGSDNRLYTVDPSNASLSLVGSTGTFFALNTLAARSDGALFSQTTFGELYRVNEGTGQATLVGPSGVFGLIPNGMLAFGPGDTLFTDISDFLHTVNQNTGAATKSGAGPLGINFPGGLVFVNGQAHAFSFFGEIFTINTTTGKATTTGITVTGGFGPIQAASLAIPVPEPSSIILFLTGVIVPGGVLFYRRGCRAVARCARSTS